jgi:membrane peptidoglycan carboxypeptidase
VQWVGDVEGGCIYMSNYWDREPQPHNNQSHTKDRSPQLMGGLLKNYRDQQLKAASILPSISGPTESDALTPQPVEPPLQSLLQESGPDIPPVSVEFSSGLSPAESDSQSASGLVAAGGQFLLPHKLLIQTLDMVRRWSGKVAIVTGHQIQPPAPFMEHPKPPSSNLIGALAIPQIPKIVPWRRSRILRTSMCMKQRRERGQGQPLRIWWSIIVCIIMLFALSLLVGSAYSYSYYERQMPHMNELANAHIAQNTRIYDRNNVLLFEVYDQNSKRGGRRVLVQYADIPKVMQDAMVAIEDKTFWMNSGIEPMAIVRAAARQYGGGSTLTQQVIKNLSNDHEYALNRKLTEAAMAIGLTQQYSKSKILEMYFNVAPFSAQTYGVEVAVEDYFDLRPACQTNQRCVPGIARLNYNQHTRRDDPLLGLARASLLAGMPNQPGFNDPTTGTEAKQRAIVRQGLVLQQMMDQGVSVAGLGQITPRIIRQAQNLMEQTDFHAYRRYKRAPHFIDWVVNQVSTALGDGDPLEGYTLFQKAGLNIRTTIDVNLEEYVERTVDRHINQPEYQKVSGYYATLRVDKNLHTAAVVVMDAKNGEILAMDGSADYNSDDPRVGGQFNAAINARPPGSTFKPIEYATAFQMGWSPDLTLRDNRTYFPNRASPGTALPTNDDQISALHGVVYAPYDYGHTYTHRLVTLRAAIANSYNIPAIKAMQFSGANEVLNTAHRLGITTQANTGLAWALGSKDVPLLQMVNAYQTFANEGERVPPQSVLDIWDNYGHNLYHYDEMRVVAGRVFSPQIANMMTSVLSDEPSRAPEFGGDHDLSFADMDPSCAYSRVLCSHQVAAKTGTTDDFRDNWTIGYTPDVVVGVWVGNADNEEMNKVIGITGAGPIWHSVMERVVGRCNENPWLTNSFVVADQIPCGPAYHFRFSKHPTWTFDEP